MSFIETYQEQLEELVVLVHGGKRYTPPSKKALKTRSRTFRIKNEVQVVESKGKRR